MADIEDVLRLEAGNARIRLSVGTRSGMSCGRSEERRGGWPPDNSVRSSAGSLVQSPPVIDAVRSGDDPAKKVVRGAQPVRDRPQIG